MKVKCIKNSRKYVSGLKPIYGTDPVEREPYAKEEIITEGTILHVKDRTSGFYVYKDYHGVEHRKPEQLISFHGDKYKLYHLFKI